MQRRPALIASTAAAVALSAASFGYAATHLLTTPADDHVGKLTATQQPAPAPLPRPVEIVYDEVPAPAPQSSAPLAVNPVASVDAPMTGDDSAFDTTTTTVTTDNGWVDDSFDTHGDDPAHAGDPQPDAHDVNDD